MENFFNIIKKTYKYSEKLGARFRRHNISEYSAYSALFIMLSFVPFFVILLNVLKFLPIFYNAPDYELIGSNEITDFLRQLLTEIDARTTGAIISLTTIVALWSAARGLTGIINGLNRIHHAKENRGFIRIRIHAVVYTLLLIVMIVVVMALLVFGEFILKTLESLFMLPPLSDGAMFSLRWLVVFLLLIIFFALMYSVLPIKKSMPLPKLPGAFFSAAGWIGFSALYSFYVRNFADYSSIYGSLAVFVLPVLWLYICMYILFIGEEINVMIGSGYLKKAIKDIFAGKKQPILSEKAKRDKKHRIDKK